VAQPCSFCDRPAAHQFVVSYRGQVLRGVICEEHGNAIARERLGLQEHRYTLSGTMIGRALTSPNTRPRFQRIAEPEHQEKVIATEVSSFSPSHWNGFSARRRRSMSRSRRSEHRGGRALRDDVNPELLETPSTADQGSAAPEPAEVRIPDITPLIRDRQSNDESRLHKTTEDDPFRVRIVDAIKALDRYAIPVESGEKKADQLLKQHGESIVRAALRAAIKERREIA
jgi:hypothetical protein